MQQNCKPCNLFLNREDEIITFKVNNTFIKRNKIISLVASTEIDRECRIVIPKTNIAFSIAVSFKNNIMQCWFSRR